MGDLAYHMWIGDQGLASPRDAGLVSTAPSKGEKYSMESEKNAFDSALGRNDGAGNSGFVTVVSISYPLTHRIRGRVNAHN